MTHKKHKRDQYSGAWSKDKIALSCLPSGALIDVQTTDKKRIRVSVNIHANTDKVRLMPIEPDELIPLESVISWRLVTLNLKPQPNKE